MDTYGVLVAAILALVWLCVMPWLEDRRKARAAERRNQWRIFDMILNAAAKGETRVIVPAAGMSDGEVETMLRAFGYGPPQPFPPEDEYKDIADKLGIVVAYKHPPTRDAETNAASSP